MIGKCHMILPTMCNLKKSNSGKQKIKFWLPGAELGAGNTEVLAKLYKILVIQKE
jgi:hypothetical protein